MSIDLNVADAEQLGERLRELGLALAESLDVEIVLGNKFESKKDVWEVVHPILKILHPYHLNPSEIGQFIYPVCPPSTSIPFMVIKEGYESAMKKERREIDPNITGLLQECQGIYSTVWRNIQ